MARISTITRKDLKVFFDKKYAERLSLATLKLLKAPMSGIFSYAVDLEMIEANPMRDVVLKYKKKPFEIEPLTEPEAQLLLEQAKIFMDGTYYAALLCALRTGLRLGEMKALKWNGIDFDKRRIEVQRSYRRGLMTDTKNHKRRRVDMTPYLTETLRTHRTSQKRDALKKGKPGSEFVFTGTRDEMLNRISFQNALNRCVEGAGLRHIRTHSLTAFKRNHQVDERA